MARIVRNFIIIILLFLLNIFPVYSEPVTQIQTAGDIRKCVKTFPVGYEKLYYLTLSGLNNQSYQIKEMQTKGGYILFENDTGDRYLATIIYVSSSKSILKITSSDGKYDFSESLVKNIFQYIENNMLKTF